MNRSEWNKRLKPYAKPDLKKALWQMVNSLVPYALLYALMIVLIQKGVPYLCILPIAIPAALFMVRIFILFHDCTHGSFLPSKRGNIIVGYFLGLFTFTPYNDWQHAHALHHANVGNLDRRGTGDVPTMTLEEYQKASAVSRILYRLIRFPVILFIFGPIAIFIISHRFPQGSTRRQDIFSIIFVNIMLTAILFTAHMTVGILTFAMVQLPVFLIAVSFGFWLFYVQHQFQSVYWSRNDQWDPVRASLEGSSFYMLPAWLNWFSASIGYHHIHHLNPRIPNYNLQRVYREVGETRNITPLTLRTSLRSLFFNLYDEKQGQMLSFWQALSSNQT